MALQETLTWIHKNLIALGVVVSTVAGLSGAGIAIYSHFAKEARVSQTECEMRATMSALGTELALLRAEIEFSDSSQRLSKLLKIENPVPVIQDEIAKLTRRINLLTALIVKWRSEIEDAKSPEEECKRNER